MTRQRVSQEEFSAGVFAAVLLLSGFAAPALGQTAPTTHGVQTTMAAAPPGYDIQISVRDVTTQGQLIRVPVNKSVLVDFNVPVREVRLAKPEFAEVTAVSPQQIIVTGKSFGTTQLIAWFNDTEQRVFDVAVDIELERLMASIRTAVPRAKVQAYALLDAIVLTGLAPDAESADRIVQIAKVFAGQVINHLRVAGVQQVMLRCTVAEVSRSGARQLGINGWFGGDDFRDMFLINNLDQINPSNIGAPEGALATSNIPFVVGENGIPVTARSTLSLGFPRVQMQVFIQALRENGLLRVLAEPNLMAVNGQDANFLAGGEVPIPIATNDRINIEFKEFGVRLHFTPTVLSENNIRLKVAPEVSEPDFSNSVTFGGISIPGFSTRRVETVVEIGSGQTLAIGGLLSDRVRAVTRSVPGLGDIPVLGTLFRSVDFQQDQTELVVLVTPELVDPISTDQVTYIPGAHYTAPNDFELFMLGQTDGAPSDDPHALQPRVNHTWPVRTDELYGDSSTAKLRGPLGPAGGREDK